MKTLVRDNFSKGSHSVVWNGSDDAGNQVSSGIYFYNLLINGEVKSVRKCLMLK